MGGGGGAQSRGAAYMRVRPLRWSVRQVLDLKYNKIKM